MQTIGSAATAAVSGKNIIGRSVQTLINKGARFIASCPVVNGNCYKGALNVSYVLQPSSNGYYNLGTSKAARAVGMPTGGVGICKTAYYGKVSGVNVNAVGVKTRSNLKNMALTFTRFYRHVKRGIKSGLTGAKPWGFNTMVAPLCTTANYRPCAVYTQFNIINGVGHLIVNYRAQHLYMLGLNLQYFAYVNIRACQIANVQLGTVTLQCNHHHVIPKQNPLAVVGRAAPYMVGPNAVTFSPVHLQ